MSDEKIKIVIQLPCVGHPLLSQVRWAKAERKYLFDLGRYIWHDLTKRGYEVKFVSYWFEPEPCDIFMVLRCGGDFHPNRGGYRISYPSRTQVSRLSRIERIRHYHRKEYNRRLARRLAAACELRFPHRCLGVGGPINDRFLFGFTLSKAKVKIFFQVGYITNPRERNWLRLNKKIVALVIGEAIERFLSYTDLSTYEVEEVEQSEDEQT
jgi:hypothetical protein